LSTRLQKLNLQRFNSRLRREVDNINKKPSCR